jgi:DNA (cytosine-5)-methyltransferase 1
VQRHSPSRGAKGEDVAATIAARFGVSRNNYEECVSQKNTPVWPAVVASTLNAHFGDKLGLEDQHALNGAPLFVGGNDVAPYQEVVGSLCARDHKAIGNQCVAQGKIVVAFTQNCREEVRDLNNVAGALAANEGSHQRTLLAYTKAKRAQSATDDESWVAGVVAPTQNAFDVGDTRATTAVVAIPIHDQATRFAGKNGDKFNGKGNGFGVGHNGDPSPTLTQGDKHAVAHAFYSTGGSHGLETHAEISPTLKVGSSIGIPSPVAVAQEMTVRRLTPRECERLQGFPDDWTLVPWRRGMATDGNRYKAIGNSMAVNCMEWIGERIAQVNAR